MRMIRSHQLRLSYLRSMMDKLPHGTFGTYRGRPVVYITYDPADRSVTSRNRKRFYTDSSKGSLYSVLIKEYQAAKAEYRELWDQWILMYGKKPDLVSYPLHTSVSPMITEQTFRESVPNQNPFPEKGYVNSRMQKFRSKNEMIAVKIIENMGYTCKTEIRLTGSRIYYPDVTFLVPECMKAIGVELDGAMDDFKYANKAHTRKNEYLSDGFREFKDIIFFRMTSSNMFDADLFSSYIEIALELSARDILDSL